MNGNKYLLDTNALIAFLQGNAQLTAFKSSHFIISVIEFLSYSNISENDKTLFYHFIKEAEVIDLQKENTDLLQLITNVRLKFRIKLPDAVIAASAIFKNAAIITNDDHFKKVDGLQVLNY